MPRPEVAARPPLVGEPSLTIAEFCERERISRSKYYELRKIGKGPTELRIAGVVRITPRSHAAWRRKHEKATSAPAKAAE
jgi:hypothetical protein